MKQYGDYQEHRKDQGSEGAGAVRLLGRRPADLLFVSALAAIASLALIAVVGATTLYGDDADFMVTFAMMGVPLPAVTAVLARTRATTGWISAAP